MKLNLDQKKKNARYRWAALPMADSPRIESRLRTILAPSLRRIAQSSRGERAAVLIASAALALALGVLHPVIVRRNVAASTGGIALAAESPSLSKATKKTPRFLIDTIPSNPRWTRSLPNNEGTVELVGISLRHDGKADLTGKSDPITGFPMDENDAKRVLSRSWKPDGESYPRPLYAVGLHFAHAGVPPERLLEMVLRFHSRNAAAFQVSGEGCYCSGFPTTDNGVPVDGFQAGDGVWQGDIVVPRSQKTFPARFLITGGPYPWHEDFTLSAGMDGTGESHGAEIGGQATRIAIVGPLVDAEGRKGFTLTNSALKDCDTHVIAIDRQGHEVDAVTQISSGGGGYTQTTVFFDQKTVPLKQIATIRFEARPFQAVDFGKIALYPEKVPQ